MFRTLTAWSFLIALVGALSGAEAASQKLLNSCFTSGLADEVIKGCNQVLAGKPSNKDRAKALNNRGMAYLARGDYDQAIPDLARAIELDPKTAVLFSNRAFAYMKIGKLDLARADIEKALQLKPDDPRAKATLAELEQAEASAKEGVAVGSQPASAAPSEDDLKDLDKLD